jgi:hypothetical protein
MTHSSQTLNINQGDEKNTENEHRPASKADSSESNLRMNLKQAIQQAEATPTTMERKHLTARPKFPGRLLSTTGRVSSPKNRSKQVLSHLLCLC